MTEPPSPVHVLIRPVDVADAEAIHAIRVQPSVLAGTLSLPSRRLADVRAGLERYGPDDHVLVAEVGGQVVGTAGLHVGQGKRRHVGEIGMMVHDAWQGRGLGRALLAALLEIADDYLGLTRVELEVVADNQRAVRLYESLGFAHEGRKRQALRRGDGYADLLVMARLR